MYSGANRSADSQLDRCHYVAVMGMAGSGKTKFIADLLEQHNFEGDCGLEGGK